TLLLGAVLIFPLFSALVLEDKPTAIEGAGVAKSLGKIAKSDEASLSDQPWIAAWYADRPSIWIPAEDSRIKDIRKTYPRTRWLFLTTQARGLSNEWHYIHETIW